MNILLIGSGGRESAFAWKLSQSDKCSKLFIAPGNAGTASYGKNVILNPNDFEAVKAFAIKEQINFVVVGPEEPLVLGIHNFFAEDEQLSHIPVIGPKKEGAILEGSKDFSKQFMERHGIPTAKSKSFTSDSLQEGLAYLATHPMPVVLKADGLAAGKGVLIVNNYQEAQNELQLMLDGKFGNAGSTVVVEEFLTGIELSVFILTDGKSYVTLPEAKDYKKIGVADTGLNTGGMGSVSPVPFADEVFLKKVEDQIIKPTVDGLIKDGIDYTGFIFWEKSARYFDGVIPPVAESIKKTGVFVNASVLKILSLETLKNSRQGNNRKGKSKYYAYSKENSKIQTQRNQKK